ncbi:MAG: cytochrome c biogenesis protein ResB [Actinobacteria bacterium]|nr:cytochrome c biogenesis protein ResB [Actinomycetota bacterium]
MDSAVVTWLRWGWRTLTSMRTALLLLLLLALAAIPGSVFPQREIDPARVQDYLSKHPGVGVWLDRLGMFTVYRSPWFAAIYLLLFISLIGCVAPRTLEHARALRMPPPVAPSRLSRLPSHALISVPSLASTTVVATAADALRKRRWRVRVAPDSSWLSAERGYLRETGNLLFHSALLLLVVGVGLGKGTGAEGRVVIPVGGSFSNSLAQYDDFRSGPFFNRASLQPFSVKLDKFDVSFERKGTQRGAPRKFDAYLSVREKFGGPTRKELVQVNHPLSIGAMKVYLTSHGYAPQFTVRDKSGDIVWQDSAIFAPEGGNLLSRGAVKVPDSRPQLGFQGVFAPTGLVDPQRGLQSVFPDLDNPRVFLGAFSGDLGLDEGTPQNVFSLDTSRMTRLGIAPLRVGDSWELSNGARITFDGVVRWASFVVASDRTEGIVLAGALLAILGLLLSLFVPRRRLFLRPVESSELGIRHSADDTTNHQHFEVAGLVRSGADTLANDTAELATALRGTVVETNARAADVPDRERQEQT